MALALLLAMPSPPTMAEATETQARVMISEWVPVAREGVAEAAGEWLELEVTTSGTLAGIVITDNDGADDFVFPALRAEAGQLIVVANGRTFGEPVPEGTLVLFMNKSGWTFENSGDDLVVRAADGTAGDRWVFGAGGAIDEPPGELENESSSALELPPGSASLARAGALRGAARPSPGAPNVLLARAPWPGLLLAGVLSADGARALVVCSERAQPFEPFGWELEVGGVASLFPPERLDPGQCAGWHDGQSEAVLARATGLMDGQEIAWSDWPGLSKAGPAVSASDPWGIRQPLAETIPADRPPSAEWLEPCLCAGGWAARRFEPVPAFGTERAVSGTAVAAGPELARRLLSLVDNASRTLRVNAYALTSESMAEALARAAGRGVGVQVLLEPHPVGWGDIAGGMPAATRQSLEAAGVAIRPFRTGAPFAQRDHAKYLVTDERAFAVSTENLVGAAFDDVSPNTGYAFVGNSAGLAADLAALFAWDWEASGGPPDAPGEPRLAAPPSASVEGATARLLVSPGPADAWARVVDNATMLVQVESMSADASVLGPSAPLGAALYAAAARGVRVEVLIGPGVKGGAEGTIANDLNAAARALALPLEVRVDGRAPSDDSKMHAKVLVVDQAVFLLGSHNLVRAAFESNREVSLQVADALAAGWLSDRLASDFAAAKAGSLGQAIPEGATLGDPGLAAREAALPLTSAALLVGAAVAFARALIPRPMRGRRARRRRSRPAETQAGPPPALVVRTPEERFELRVGGLPAPDPPPQTPPSVRLPPSAHDRMREG